MKILLTGSNGQLGRELKKFLNHQANELICIGRDKWDISKNPELGFDLVVENGPDIVINTAAFTDVEGAESNAIEAEAVNAIGPKFLSLGSYKLNIPIIHFSTDYVFSGELKLPYAESDLPCPINIYGRTKLHGEDYIKSINPKHIIFRLSWVFSNHGENFVNKILRLQNKEEFKVVCDQFGCPTSTESIAKMLSRILIFLSEDKFNNWGVFHFSGAPSVSWFEFAQEIYKISFDQGLIRKVPKITKCKSEDYKSTAKRPKNSRLENILINKVFGIGPCNWKKDLEKVLVNKRSLLD